MSEDQSDETSENDTMGGPANPFVLLRVRARHVICCWDELTKTTHPRAFSKTKRAIEQLEEALELHELDRVGQVVDAMTPEQVTAYLEMMGINKEELDYRATALRNKLKTTDWGCDQILTKHLSEGGTPT